MIRAALGRAWRWLRRLGRHDVEVDEPRRAALRGAAAAAGLAVLGTGGAALAANAADKKHRWGMAIDLDRCTGCNACGIACRQENNVPVFGPNDTYEAARPEWLSMLWLDDESPELLPFPCQHCEDAPCVKVCPVGATFTTEDGIVMMNYDRCIGCRYCMVACPYGRRSFNWEQPTWEGNLIQMLNPDVSTRPAGVVEKCTFCNHRLQDAKERVRMEGRELEDVDVRRLPACVSVCPGDAISFGDLNDPDSTVSEQSRSPRAFRLLEHLGTVPKVTYLRRDES